MAESVEHMVNKLVAFSEVRDAFASEHRLRRDPETDPLHYFVNRELEHMPGMKMMLKDLVAHPQLVLADLRAYRAHVQKNGHCYDDPDLQEKPKCSARAAELRFVGNVLYAMRQCPDALEKYNEAICFAPNDSEELGLGYANKGSVCRSRSAVFCENGDCELALANIALAKKHNYPERLMPKLLAREAKCHEMMNDPDFKSNAVRFPTLPFHLEANPRIPFLAKGIFARKLPVHGNSMLAEKGFKAGDVILREKPLKVSVGFQNKYFSCNHCLSENLLHLIPCPNCTAAMFCNEECMAEGQKTHRFECGITAELSFFNDFWSGPRMFFHGLTLFGDDVKKMMEFCQANKESGGSFFDVDYSNYDPLEEFKAFLAPQGKAVAQKPLFDNLLQHHAAIMYTMCMKVPLVRSLITSKKQKDFMLQCFFDFMILANYVSVHQDIDGQLYPIASCFGQSNDPNAIAVDYGGQLKLIVLRPIRRGERIIVSYGHFVEKEVARRHARMRSLGIVCQCRFCEEKKCQAWLSKVPKGKSIVPAHFQTVKRVMADMDLNNADKLNACQQFIQRYADLHPHEALSNVLSAYRFILSISHENEMKAAIREKISG